MRAWRPSLCAKTARTSASVKTTGTRAGRFARSTLSSHSSSRPRTSLVEEHDSAKRLILGRSRYVSLDRKVGQKALDLGFAHGVRMALPMK